MKNKISNEDYLIAACGLFCANCGKFKKAKCPGCRDNEKASWCKIRSCCKEKNIVNCSYCNEFEDPKACRLYNNPVSRAIEFILTTDRSLCIKKIKSSGSQEFIELMKQNNWTSIPRKKIT